MHDFRTVEMTYSACPGPDRPVWHACRGFTLIELMITVVVVAILAAVAYPSFMSQIRKARRSDAVDLASGVQQLQERYRANNPTYADGIGSLGLASGVSANGYYTISTAPGAGATASSYSVTATAVSGKSQASDSGCTTMSLSVSNATLSYTPAGCWSR